MEILDHESSDMDVSENSGTPKSSILIGVSIINHPFWGTPYFRKHPYGDDDILSQRFSTWRECE